MQVGCWRAFQGDFIWPFSSLFDPGEKKKILCGTLVCRFQNFLLSLLFIYVGSTAMDIDSLVLKVVSEYFSDLCKDVFLTGCNAAGL